MPHDDGNLFNLLLLGRALNAFTVLFRAVISCDPEFYV